jgi:RNA polymerase sigma factor (sigma-70 family)
VKPLLLTSPTLAARTTDEELVRAVREGSDEAFEVLVRRYRDRIGAHVRRHVYDGERTEDIVQEVFVSTLRGLRSSDQEITFRPWIYMIARNACIDHARRAKRSEEVSVDWQELGAVFDMSVGDFSPTERTVLRKQELDDINQAFGALPASQHRILVLRELEGLSYKEIGRRMRLTPAAVESMLSRARTTVKGQYEEITTGARCARMRAVMTGVSRGLAGKRDRSTLARHVRHCRSCRHQALAMGLDAFVVQAQRRGIRAGLQRAAAIFPLGWFLRRSDGAAGALGGAGAEHGATAAQKLAAVLAVAAVAGGGGIAVKKAGVNIPVPKPIGSIYHHAAPVDTAARSDGEQGSAKQASPGENRSGETALPTGSQQLPPAVKKRLVPGQSIAQQPPALLPPTSRGTGSQPATAPSLPGTGQEVATESPAATSPLNSNKKTDAVAKTQPGIQKNLDTVLRAPAQPNKNADKKAQKLLDKATKALPKVDPPAAVTLPTVSDPPSGIQGMVDGPATSKKKQTKAVVPSPASLLR